MYSTYQRAILQLLEIPLWNAVTNRTTQTIAPHPLLDDITTSLVLCGYANLTIDWQFGNELVVALPRITLPVQPGQLTAAHKRQLWQLISEHSA